MLTFEMKRDMFIDIIKKMVIPTTSHAKDKPKFLFPTIALTIRPDKNEIEWMGESQHVITWIRANCPISSDTTEVVQIPINASEFLKELNSLKYKNFKNNKNGENKRPKTTHMISFSCDPADGYITLIRNDEVRVATSEIAATPMSAVQGLLNEFPFRVERDTDIILFKNGLVRPNISGSCDIKILQELVKNVKHQKQEIQRNKDKALMKKIEVRPLAYNIYVDDNQLKIVAGAGKYLNENFKTGDDIIGHGELHYLDGFAEVSKILSGTIKFYAIDNGPLWIMQDTENIKVRYLIAPAAPYVY